MCVGFKEGSPVGEAVISIVGLGAAVMPSSVGASVIDSSVGEDVGRFSSDGADVVPSSEGLLEGSDVGNSSSVGDTDGNSVGSSAGDFVGL